MEKSEVLSSFTLYIYPKGSLQLRSLCHFSLASQTKLSTQRFPVVDPSLTAPQSSAFSSHRPRPVLHSFSRLFLQLTKGSSTVHPVDTLLPMALCLPLPPTQAQTIRPISPAFLPPSSCPGFSHTKKVINRVEQCGQPSSFIRPSLLT